MVPTQARAHDWTFAQSRRWNLLDADCAPFYRNAGNGLGRRLHYGPRQGPEQATDAQLTAASARPPRTAPEGAPNVLLVLYDDVGLSAWSPFGGRIHMPALQRIADRGLLYSQWHTAGLSPPTRYLLLTGRAIVHKAVRLRGPPRLRRSQAATAFPSSTRRSRECFAMPAGACSGWARTTTCRRTSGTCWRPRSTGRCAWAQCYPDLVENHRYIEQPYTPEQGYHLSKDLADRALSLIRRTRLESPKKPWYLWFCPGANHRPHHAPRDYIDRYKGQFDDGYDRYREGLCSE
jgi:Sulfatase